MPPALIASVLVPVLLLSMPALTVGVAVAVAMMLLLPTRPPPLAEALLETLVVGKTEMLISPPDWRLPTPSIRLDQVELLVVLAVLTPTATSKPTVIPVADELLVVLPVVLRLIVPCLAIRLAALPTLSEVLVLSFAVAVAAFTLAKPPPLAVLSAWVPGLLL